jgi:hypothetical protein
MVFYGDHLITYFTSLGTESWLTHLSSSRPVLTLRKKPQILHRLSQAKEWHMQSTNIRQIMAALWDQAFIRNTLVSCPMGPVVAVRKRKGHLLAMIHGWGRWDPVESVCIERKGAGGCQLLS